MEEELYRAVARLRTIVTCREHAHLREPMMDPRDIKLLLKHFDQHTGTRAPEVGDAVVSTLTKHVPPIRSRVTQFAHREEGGTPRVVIQDEDSDMEMWRDMAQFYFEYVVVEPKRVNT